MLSGVLRFGLAQLNVADPLAVQREPHLAFEGVNIPDPEPLGEVEQVAAAGVMG